MTDYHAAVLGSYIKLLRTFPGIAAGKSNYRRIHGFMADANFPLE